MFCAHTASDSQVSGGSNVPNSFAIIEVFLHQSRIWTDCGPEIEFAGGPKVRECILMCIAGNLDAASLLLNNHLAGPTNPQHPEIPVATLRTTKMGSFLAGMLSEPLRKPRSGKQVRVTMCFLGTSRRRSLANSLRS